MSCFTTYFVRHGKSEYGDIYPDLTKQGVLQAKKAGMKLKEKLTISTYENLKLISSPAVRAQGTVDLIADCLGFVGHVKKEPLLADMVIIDRPRAMKIFANASKKNDRIENVYDMDSIFEDSSIFEPRSLIRQRFYLFLRKLIENINSYDGDILIAISHFEILNHFVQKLWPGARIVDYADIIKLQFSSNKHSDLVNISVEFDDQKGSYVSSFILESN